MPNKQEPKIEMEEVTLQIPKNIMNLLRAHFADPANEYIQYSIIQSVKADIDHGDVFTGLLISRYGLKPILDSSGP